MRKAIKVPDFRVKGDDEKPLYPNVKVVHINDAIKSALLTIDNERHGKQKGLYSRWLTLNIAQGKYFRFGRVVTLASASGHGKSYVSNMLTEDFTELKPIVNKRGELIRAGLNENFDGNMVVLDFTFEQSPEDEVIRTFSRLTGNSYSKLVSGEYDFEKNDFNALSDDDYDRVKKQSNFMIDRPIYYFPNQTDVILTYRVVEAFAKANPGVKIVVKIDHTFLHKKIIHSQSDLALVQDIAHMALALKKNFDCLVILLHQLSQKIEDMDRILKPELHAPKTSDIYMINEIKWACDDIYVFPYRPAMNNILKYGTQRYDTRFPDSTGVVRDLVVCSKVKSRNGFLCDLYFQEKFAQGKLDWINEDEIPTDKKNDH